MNASIASPRETETTTDANLERLDKESGERNPLQKTGTRHKTQRNSFIIEIKPRGSQVFPSNVHEKLLELCRHGFPSLIWGDQLMGKKLPHIYSRNRLKSSQDSVHIYTQNNPIVLRFAFDQATTKLRIDQTREILKRIINQVGEVMTWHEAGPNAKPNTLDSHPTLLKEFLPTLPPNFQSEDWLVLDRYYDKTQNMTLWAFCVEGTHVLLYKNQKTPTPATSTKPGSDSERILKVSIPLHSIPWIYKTLHYEYELQGLNIKTELGTRGLCSIISQREEISLSRAQALSKHNEPGFILLNYTRDQKVRLTDTILLPKGDIEGGQNFLSILENIASVL